MIGRWNVIEKKLTYKQAAFCREYVSNKGNATQAYLAAYDTTNTDTANTEGWQLLQLPQVKAEIDRLVKPCLESSKSERERVKDKLWSIINDPEEKTENVCRAADILNRMNAEYIQRTESTSETSVKLDKSTLEGLLSE